MKTLWNGQVIAESADMVVVEGNRYFPAATLDRRHIATSATTSVCPWKDTAHYYTPRVTGLENPDPCRYFPEPKPALIIEEANRPCTHGF